jgi:hypothetical protein
VVVAQRLRGDFARRSRIGHHPVSVLSEQIFDPAYTGQRLGGQYSWPPQKLAAVQQNRAFPAH